MLYGTLRNWLLLSLAMFRGPIGWMIIPLAALAVAGDLYFGERAWNSAYVLKSVVGIFGISCILALLLSAIGLLCIGFKKSPGGWRGYAKLRGAALRSYHNRLPSFVWNVVNRVADSADF